MRRALGLLLAAAVVAGSACTDRVTSPAAVVLPAPTSLTSISLNGAVHLSWTDNPFLSDPADFDHYRAYSTTYSLDSNLCGSQWSLEGTTVAPVFLVGALTNGVPRCFAVSAISVDGTESQWSPLRNDTPRPDARNVLVYTQAGDPNRSGFRFWLDANGNARVDSTELGLVIAGSSASADFTVQASGAQLLIAPVRAAVQVQRYGTQAVGDLTDIDFAPAGGYSSASIAAQVGNGYVFQINEGDGFFRYGGLRVTALGPNYIIFDWSYQTDPGNPELLRVFRLAGQ